jgi:hypothetical protein
MSPFQRIMNDYDYVIKAIESCRYDKENYMISIVNLMNGFFNKHSRKNISVEYQDLKMEMMIRMTEKYRNI